MGGWVGFFTLQEEAVSSVDCRESACVVSQKEVGSS